MAEDFTARNLRRMSDADLDVADNEPDIRGWRVITPDDHTVGKVDDLIVDTAAMKVRFVQLDPDKSMNMPDREDIYVPIERVDLDRDHKRVVLRGGAADVATLGRLVSPDISRQFPARQRDRTDRDTGRTDRDSGDARRMTRAEEEVQVRTRPMDAGEVRVGKHEETRPVDVDVRREAFDIHDDRQRSENVRDRGEDANRPRGGGR